MASSSPRHRVVVLEPGYESYETERTILAPLGAEVEPVAWGDDEEAIAAAVKDADAVMVRESPIGVDAIEAMTRCRVIVRYGIGVDNIDLDAARRRHIFVANVPDYGADEVSDHAVALLLALMRRVAARDRAVRNGAWCIGQREKIYPIKGRALGLLGFGRIAREVHRKLLAFGIGETLVHDPYLADEDAAAAGVVKSELGALCQRSDIVSLHAPLTPETRHIIDGSALALMKPSTVLVNTARGPLVDEAALLRTLQEKRIFGAALDVFETEPPASDSPFFDLDNVIVTDHVGWYSEASVEELQTKSAEEVARVLSGERPRSWVNGWET